MQNEKVSAAQALRYWYYGITVLLVVGSKKLELQVLLNSNVDHRHLPTRPVERCRRTSGCDGTYRPMEFAAENTLVLTSSPHDYSDNYYKT